MPLSLFLWKLHSFSHWQVRANFSWIMNALVLRLFLCLWSEGRHAAKCAHAHLESFRNFRLYYILCSKDYVQEQQQLVVNLLFHIFCNTVIRWFKGYYLGTSVVVLEFSSSPETTFWRSQPRLEKVAYVLSDLFVNIVTAIGCKSFLLQRQPIMWLIRSLPACVFHILS